MPLETATYISQLTSTNPAHSDGLNQADAHLRLIKSVLQAQFPNFTAAVLNSTQAQLDAAVAAVVTRPNATVPAGTIMDFAGTTAPAGWLACDGTSLLRSDFTDLFAAIGTTWGAVDGTHFSLPNFFSRYRRHRDNSTLSGAVGTMQSPCNLAHTHPVVGSTNGADRSLDHSHNFSGTTGNDSPDHAHSFSGAFSAFATAANGPGAASTGSGVGGTTAGASARHQHAFGGTTAGVNSSIDHNHSISFTSGGGSADGAENRPWSATVLTCIKF